MFHSHTICMFRNNTTVTVYQLFLYLLIFKNVVIDLIFSFILTTFSNVSVSDFSFTNGEVTLDKNDTGVFSHEPTFQQEFTPFTDNQNM